MKQLLAIFTTTILLCALSFKVTAQSTETDFLTFSFSEQTGDATINTTDHTIQIEVVTGTDVSNLTPTFSLSDGATTNPESGTSQDFTSSYTYTITAEDGVTTQDWLVTVSIALNDATDILSFSLEGQVYSSTIDTTNHTIDVPLPYGITEADLSDIVAQFEVSQNAVSSDPSGDSFNLSSSLTLSVTAEDEVTTQDWVITAWPEPIDYSKLIAYYPFDRTGIDISGNGYSSYSFTTVNGTDRFGKNYVLGEGAEFEYEEALDILFQDSYSIAFWIKVNEASDGNILRTPGLTLDYESTAGIIHSTITVSDGTTIAGPMISVTTGVWEHCIFTSNGIEFVTYRNGVQEGSTAPDTNYLFSNGSFIVGDVDADYEIDDMLILNEPVNGTEAEDLYQYQLDEFYQLAKPLFSSIDHPEEQKLPNININDRTVNLVMSASEDLTNLEVSVRLIDNAIVKLGDVEKTGGTFTDDFSSDVQLSFVSEDGFTQQDWTVSTRNVNSETDFLTFTLPEQTGDALITSIDHIIEIEVARGTDLSNLTPTFTLSEGASSDIASGIARDFSDTVTYMVQAEDRSLSAQAWQVVVTFAPNTETDFESFSIEGSAQVANISTTDHTIEMDVEAGSDLTYLVPIFTLSEGAVAETGSGIARDFSSDVDFPILAEDEETQQNWVVSISNIPTEYTFTSVNPVTGSLIDVSSTNFVLSFTDPLPENLLVKDNFGITSRLSGEIDFTLTGGNTENITLTPSNDLLPGDDITVIVRNNLITGGESLRYKTFDHSNSGPISFLSGQEITLSSFDHRYFEIVDLDADRNLDLLSMAESHNGSLVWSQNQGSDNLTFSSEVIPVNADYDGDLYTLDLDRDGILDPVLGRSGGGGGAAIYVEELDAGRVEYLFPGDGDLVKKILTADLNNDLRPDIVTLEGQILVLFQNRQIAEPSFTLETKVMDIGVLDFILEDLNADGHIDILAQSNLGIRAYYNSGNANPDFNPFGILGNSDNRPFTVGHLVEGEAIQFVIDRTDIGITIYNLTWDESIAEPGISSYHTISESTTSSALLVADMDGDGDMDIVSSEDQLVWYENVTASTPDFSRNIISDGYDSDHTLHVADLNGDNLLDVIIATGTSADYYEAVSSTPETDFLSFSLDGQVFSSTIDTVNHTIDIPMPHGSLDLNPQSTFELSEGASAGFISGDFIPFQAQRGRTLTVTSSNGASTQDWTATVWPIPVEPTNIDAYYPFDGNGLDISGNGHNGTISGALGTRLDRFGQSHSLALGAKFSFPSAFNLFNQSSYTVAFWVKVSDSPDGVVMSSPAVSLEYENVAGEIHSKFSTENGTVNGPNIPVSNNQWEHCAFTITGEQIRSYRNGVFESSTTGSTSFLFENGDFNIGDQSAFFEIDDVLILSYPANSTEIEEIYNEQADEFYQRLRPLFYGIDHPDQVGLEIFDFSNRTVDIEMPSGTDLSDLSFQTRLIGEPTIKIGGVEQSGSIISGDFSEDVTLTFVSADGLTTQEWLIRVTLGDTPINQDNTLTNTNIFNGLGRTRDYELTLRFSDVVASSLLSGSNIRVTGSESGIVSGTIEGGGTSTIIFRPSELYRAGEEYSVYISDNILTDAIEFTFKVRSMAVEGVSFIRESLFTDPAAASEIAYAKGDLDSDGDLDLAVVLGMEGTVSWLENQIQSGNGFVKREIDTEVPNIGTNNLVRVADLDLDGTLDVIYASKNSEVFQWYSRDGNIDSEFVRGTIANQGVDKFEVRDVDLDGNPDIICFHDDTFFVFYNDGGSNPSFSRIDFEVSNLTSVIKDFDVGDIDGDGYIDIVVSATQGDDFHNIEWYENKGNRQFTRHTISNSIIGEYYVRLIGNTLSSRLDVVINRIEASGDGVYQFIHDSPGSFTVLELSTEDEGRKEVAIGTIFDGIHEDIVTYKNASTLSVFRNFFEGTDQTWILTDIVSEEALSGVLLTGDLDNDGDIDIIQSSKSGSVSELSWFANGGTSTSSETDFLSFSFDEQTGPAVINTTDHTITVEVVSGTSLSAIIPTFTLSEGATSSPAAGDGPDFSNPVTYTVTAEDGTTTQDWTITVTVSNDLSTETDILSFEFPSQVGSEVVNSANHTVDISVSQGTNVTDLTPIIDVSSGATINPASGVSRNFSNPVTYTVTAQDGTTIQDWIVTVTVSENENSETDITSFKLPNQIGEEVIDVVNHTVDVTLPIGSDRSNLTPTIEVSFGATVDPESGEARDFNFENTYTVTAQDLVSTESWAVNARFEANTMPTDITIDNAKLFAVTGANQLVGKFQVLDPNEMDVHTLSIVPGSQFALDGNSLITSNELEAGNYGVTIAAQDLAGAQISRNFTIEVIAIETDNSISVGTSIDDYRIIGLPTDRVRVSSVFTNLTMEEQGSSWRILDYQSDGSYNDLSLNSEMLAGKGYWILADKEVTVALDQDPATLDDDGNFILRLRPGWNLISNPFFEEFNWNQNIQRNVEQGNITTSDIQTGVIVYNGAYSSSTSLDLLQGGWVNVFASSDISIDLRNPAASQGSSGRVALAPINELRFTLSDESRASTLAGFSFLEEASLQLDSYDQIYPPAVSSDRTLRLVGTNGIDFIAMPPTASFHEKWQVVAPSSQALNLSWESGQLTPFARQFYLIRNDEQVVDMTQVSELKVNHGDQIEVVTGLVDHRLIVQTFPNPADNLLRVKISSFAAEMNEEIQLKIFDMTGKVLQENRFRYQQEVQLSTASLPDGLYIVRTWIGDELMDEEKIMIQHK